MVSFFARRVECGSGGTADQTGFRPAREQVRQRAPAPPPPSPPAVPDARPAVPTSPSVESVASVLSVDEDDDLPLAQPVASLGAMPRGVEFGCRVAVYDNTVTFRGLFSATEEDGTISCDRGTLHYASASERGQIVLADGAHRSFRLEAGGGARERRTTVAVLRTPRSHCAGERESAARRPTSR